MNAPDDETSLLARAASQDTAAFEQIYREHVGRVHALCLRMTADVREAEELTQQAFVQLWKKLPLFRGESAFSSWLHRLTVNLVLNHFRATQRRAQRVHAVDDPAAFETPTAPAPGGLRLDLEQAIASLPRQARTVFVLHDIEGYQHDEIAALLDIAVGTSKAQCHRARKLLQEALR